MKSEPTRSEGYNLTLKKKGKRREEKIEIPDSFMEIKKS